MNIYKKLILFFLIVNISLFSQNRNFQNALDHYNNRRYESSIASLEAMNIKPSDIDAYLLLIDNYIKIGNYDMAETLVKDAESYHSKNYKVLEKKLNIALLRNKNTEARAIINDIKRLDSKNYFANYAEGLLNERMGYYKTAINLYERALIIDKKRPEAAVALAYLKLANNETKVAYDLLNRNVANNQTNPEAYYHLANYFYLTKNYQAALKEIENAFYYYRDYDDCKILKANVLLALKNYTDAIAILDYIPETRFPNNTKYYYIGNVYEDAKNYNDAKIAYIKYLKENPDNELGRLAYERVLLKTNPNPDYERDRAALYYANSSSYYTRLADNIRAKSYLKHMLKLNPANTYARLMLSDVYRRMKLEEKALEELEIARNINPDDKSISYKYDSYKRKLDKNIPSRAWGIDNQYNIVEPGYRVAIVNTFEVKKESPLYLNESFYQTLSYVLPQYERFRVVDLYDRESDNLQNQLKENKIDYYLRGNTFYNYDNFTIMLELIDVKTTKIVTNFSLTTKGKEKLVSSAVTTGRIIDNSIPFFAQIIKMHNDNIYINAGRRHGITNDMNFKIFNTTSPSTEIEKNNSMDYIGMLKIVNVDENVSLAKVIDGRILGRLSLNQIVVPFNTNNNSL